MHCFIAEIGHGNTAGPAERELIGMTTASIRDLRRSVAAAQSREPEDATELMSALETELGGMATCERVVRWFADSPATDDSLRRELNAALSLPADDWFWGPQPRLRRLRELAEDRLAHVQRAENGTIVSLWGDHHRGFERAVAAAMLAATLRWADRAREPSRDGRSG